MISPLSGLPALGTAGGLSSSSIVTASLEPVAGQNYSQYVLPGSLTDDQVIGAKSLLEYLGQQGLSNNGAATQAWVAQGFQPLLADNGGTPASQMVVINHPNGTATQRRLVARVPLSLSTPPPDGEDVGNILLSLNPRGVTLDSTNQVGGFDARVTYLIRTVDSFLTGGRVNADGTIAYTRGIHHV